MSIVDLTGHPEISATFHFPCHDCGQSIEVVDTVRQPHECRTYETDAERICAAYWAGYERAQQNLLSGVNDGSGDHSIPPSGADVAPNESKGAAPLAPAPLSTTPEASHE